MDRYWQIKKLGEGGFGEVWLCQDVTTSKLVAIKYLTKINNDSVKRFQREAMILETLKESDLFVEILDYSLDNDPPAIIMEYLSRGSLATYIPKGIPLDSSLIFTSIMARALAFLHSKSAFHRDVKPANILIKELGDGLWTVKLGDFGLAQHPDCTSNLTRGPGGTQPYLAPELSAGAMFNYSCDVYSLGITLLEMVTAGNPYLHQFDPSDVSIEVVELIYAMTDKEPSKRPTAKGVVEFIDTMFNRVRANHQEQPPAIQSQIQKSKAGDIVAGGLVAAGLIGLMVMLFGKD